MRKQARANVPGMRQRTQYTCGATSLTAALRALGKDVTEDQVNDIVGAAPGRGVRWEEVLAAAQYFGCRGTLVVPAMLSQLKEWTSAGLPVLIAWNPEGRPWSHVSVVYDVDEQDNVHIMDPNIPDPAEFFRIVPRAEFFKKWGEQWGDRLIVRRPALVVELEIDEMGRQTRVASLGTTVLDNISGDKDMSNKIFPAISIEEMERRIQAKLADEKESRFPAGKPVDVAEHYREKGNLDAARKWEKYEGRVEEVADDGEDDDREARFQEGVPVDVAKHYREQGNEEAARKWEEHEGEIGNRAARFKRREPGDPPVDVPAYLRESGNPEAADEWERQNELHRDKFKNPEGESKQASAPSVEDIEEWWEYLDPSSMRRISQTIGLSTLNSRRWHAQDWERAMDYYVRVEMGDSRGYDAPRALWSPQKVAASGLYGYTKATQRDCEAAANKIYRAAEKIARSTYKRDNKVSQFLSIHQQRTESLPAGVLIHVMKDLGPKFASERTARGGLYGFSKRTVKLGLRACTDLRREVGQIAADLHQRRQDRFDRISGYLDNHCKQANCSASRLLLASFPHKKG